MKHLLTFLIFCLGLFNMPIQASHLLGAEVTYRYLGGLKYELNFKVYRDCRGVPLNSIPVEMMGGSLIDTLYPTRVSITDVTPTCKKVSNYCNPANQTTTSSNYAIELHWYRDTVDFNKQDSAFKKYCTIKFGTGGCCKSLDMWTGTDVWVWSELDICKAKNNSSPIIADAPYNILCCNQPLYYSFNARDTSDYDSLSYSFIEPYVNWTKYIPYPSAPDEWITSYWPSGYNRKNGPAPDRTPPVGIYLDPETGDLIFTPTDCSDLGNMAIRIIEWRKDSSGKYLKIGEMRRDMLYQVQTCPGNNPPKLSGPYKFDVCSGNQICFTVTPSDAQYIPPPPAKANPPDSVTLSWNYGIAKGAKFDIVDKTARLQSGKFCWTPKESDAKDLPYYFTVTARDNNCPLNAVISKSYSVKVKAVARTEAYTKKLSSSSYELNSKISALFSGMPNYRWEVSDSLDGPLDKATYYFHSNKTRSISVRSLDTIQFRRGGKYFIHHYINNPPLNCPTYYIVDTLTIPVMMEASIEASIDTFICSYDSVHLTAKAINGTPPYKFQWGYNPKDSFTSFTLTTQKDSLVELFVTDAKGQKSDFWYQVNQRVYPKPIVEAGKNVSICVYDSIKLKATATYVGDSIYWYWTFNLKQVGNKAELMAKVPGYYYLQVSDINGCKSMVDSVNLKHSVLSLSVNAGKDKSICYGDSVLLIATGLDTTFKLKGKYQWLDLPTQRSVSNLTTYYFKDKVDSRFVVVLEQTDTLKCKATVSDTVEVKVKSLPEVELGRRVACQNETEFSLHSIVLKPKDISKGTQTWQLKKTLDKPGGLANKPEDLIYNKDKKGSNDFFIKIGETNIDLHGRYFDSLRLVLIYTDEYGCISQASNNAGIIIRSHLGVSFLQDQIPICHGDSITYLSNDYGVNFYGGKWFTSNDSSAYFAWPYGNNVDLKEKVHTAKLPNTTGVYLLRYTLENNQCFSTGHTKLKIETLPKIQWSEVTLGDTITLTDKSLNSTSREWVVGSFSPVSSASIKLSRFIASTKTITLKVKNGTCEKDSVIKPAFTGGMTGMSLKVANLYPNPTSTILNIDQVSGEKMRFQLLNALGQAVLTKEVIDLREEINMAYLPSGIYTVILSSKSGQWHEKVIKH